jgi:hypothetical protein
MGRKTIEAIKNNINELKSTRTGATDYGKWHCWDGLTVIGF